MFISGYLSKGVTSHREKELNTLLYPFVVFQIAYTSFFILMTRGTFDVNLFSPVYLTWYMICLFFCRLFLPYLRMLKKNVCIFILLLLSFAAGFFVSNNFLAFYRTFYFLPIFYLGYSVTNLETSMEKIYNKKWYFYFFFTITSIIVFILSYMKYDNYAQIRLCFTTDSSFRGLYTIDGGKVFGFVISLFMTLSFCLICYDFYRRKNAIYFFEKVGENTMSIYSLHGFFVLTLIVILYKVPSIASIPIGLASAAVLCWLLSRDKVVNIFDFAFDFKHISNKLNINPYN